MSETEARWSPGVRYLLADLVERMEKENLSSGELQVLNDPAVALIGRDISGNKWVRIECDREEVAMDDLTALVSFKRDARGYLVIVNPNAPEKPGVRFLEEIVDLLVDGCPAGEAGKKALQGFRDLMAKPPGAPLEEHRLVGLFGELEVLETVLTLPEGKLEHWTGWERDHCDFRLPGLVVEVKSTLSADYRRVQIHGLGQLADPEDGSDLILALRRLERSPEGRSVPELAEAIIKLGASRFELFNNLADVGCFEQHFAEYEERKFVSQEIALRRIDEAHPRLTPEILAEVNRSQIDRVNYELDLNDERDSDLDMTINELLADHLQAGSAS